MSNDTQDPRPDWGDVPPILFDHIVARVIELEPACASTLLCVSSSFHRAACGALYEHVTMTDDENELIRPQRRSQMEALVRYPAYASYVRSLTLLGRPPLLSEHDDSSFFSFVPQRRGPPLRPETLANLLSRFESLEAFTWMTNVVPPDDMCYVLATATPGLRTLIVRPQLRRESEEEATQWNPKGLHKLPCLRELTLSLLSTEGGKTLAAALPYVHRIEYLTLDMATVGDFLLSTVATECKSLVELTIRTSSTKASDAGIAKLLSACSQLRSLVLSDCQGRFTSKLWPSIRKLPFVFTKFGVAFNEVGPPHHTWIVDHVAGVFHTLAAAPQGLTHFSVTRIIPQAALVAAKSMLHSGSIDGLGLSNLQLEARNSTSTAAAPGFVPACDDIVAPRRLPTDAITLLAKHGVNLKELELDFFVIDLDELRAILLACLKLERLRVHIDAPMSKILALSSVFAPLTELQVLEFSLTELHCPRQHHLLSLPQTSSQSHGFGSTVSPLPGFTRANTTTHNRALALNAIAVAWPGSASVSPTLSRTSEASIFSDLSPSSTATSLFGDTHEAPIMSTPSSSPKAKAVGMRRSSAVPEEAPIGGSGVGNFDNSVPSERMIRKFARRCHKLKVMRWTGRSAVGEWRIGNAGVEFVPASSLTLSDGSLESPHCGYDPSVLRRRTSATSALREKSLIGFAAGDALPGDDNVVSTAATLSVPHSLPTPTTSQRRASDGAKPLQSDPTTPRHDSLTHRRTSAQEGSLEHVSNPFKPPGASTRQWSVVTGSRLQAQQAASQSIASAATPAGTSRRRTRDSSGNVIIGHGRKEKSRSPKTPQQASWSATKVNSLSHASPPPRTAPSPVPLLDTVKAPASVDSTSVRRFVPGSGMPDPRGEETQEAQPLDVAGYTSTSRRLGPSAPGSINGGVTRKTTHLKRMTSRGGSAAGANTQVPRRK